MEPLLSLTHLSVSLVPRVSCSNGQVAHYHFFSHCDPVCHLWPSIRLMTEEVPKARVHCISNVA
jgi:hypothetical protein